MGITAAELIARVSVQGAAAAEGQLLGVGKASDAAEARFRSLAVVGSGLLVAGLVGVGIASVKMAGDFQQGVNRLRTGAGDSQDSFNSLTKGILGVSVATGQMTKPLIDAMYLILSSGQRGAQAFDTLKVAAEGAVIEQAKVADVANVLSGIMTNYGTKVYGATQYMNGLVFAVAHGKITLQDLAVAMGPIDPIAKHLGISMADVAAAMTTQTNAMIPAARAATGLRFMMSALENPTHKAKVAMADLGLDSVKVAEEMTRSLPGALQMIVKAALKVGPEGSVPFNRAVGDMVGGIRGLSAFMGLTGTHMKDFIANSQGITAAMKNGAGGVQGWAIAQSNFNVQMDRAKASVAAAGIGLGLLLLPALTHLASLIPAVVQYFSDFSSHAGVLVPILAGIGAVLVGLLVPAMWSLAAGVIAATWPVLLIGVAVAGAVAILLHFYSTSTLLAASMGVLSTVFGTLSTTLANIVGFFKNNQLAADALAGALVGAAVVIATVVVPPLVVAFIAWAVAAGAAAIATIAATWPLLLIGAAVALVVTGIILAIQHWGAIMAWIGNVMSAVGTFIHGVLSAIGAFVGSIFSAMGSKVHEVLSGIGSFVGGVFSKIGTDIHDKLTGAKNTTGNVFSAIGTTIHDKLTDAKNAVGTAFSGIGTMFTWLYNHNKYIKLLCDAIVLEFKMAIAWIQSAWTNTVSWLAGKWNGLLGVAGAVFSAIGTFIHNVMTTIWGWIVSVWTAVTGWLSAQWNRLSALAGSVFSLIGSLIHDKMLQAASLIYNVWNAISSWMSGKLNDIKNLVGNAFSILGTLMHDKMVQAWNGLVSLANGWPSQAFQWGVNLIQGIIGGIGNMLGALGNMLGNVAGQIAGALGFHHGSLIPPKEGPAKDADQWMPALMHGLVWGIEQGTPDVHTALGKLMRPLATQARASLSLQATGSLGNLGGNLSTPGLSASYALRSASGGGQTIVINVAPPDVTLDGQRLTRAQMPYIVNSIRANAPARF